MKVQELEFPDASTAVETTVFEPTGNDEPDAGWLVTVALPAQTSVAAGWLKFNMAMPESRGDSATLIFAGQVICGGVVSCTVIMKVHALLLPYSSDATLVTMFVPSGKSEPDGGVETTITFVSQRPKAVTLNATGVPAGPAHSATMFEGQMTWGGVVTTTEIVWEQEAVLLQASAACQVRVVLKVKPSKSLVTVSKVTVTFVPPHESWIEGASNVHGDPHSTTRFEAQVITGGLVF